MLGAVTRQVGLADEGRDRGFVLAEADFDAAGGEFRDLDGDGLALAVDVASQRIAAQLLDAQADAFLLDVDVEHAGLDHFALLVAGHGFFTGGVPVDVRQVHHAVDVVVEADEQAELGGVLDLAFHARADRVLFEELLPGVLHGLLEAQADAALGGVDVEHHDFHFLRRGDDLAGVDVLLGPGHFRDVDQAFDTGLQLHEGAVVGDVGDPAGELGAHRVLGFHAVPRVGLELLHAQADALGVGVDLDDLHLDGVAHGQDLAGVRDALPGHVGDVQQAVDAAQVHERAVVGDVLDHAFADFTLLQLRHQFGALLGAGFFQDGAAGDDDVAARAVHLEDRERLLAAHQRADVAHRTDVHLRARQERRGAAQVDGEAALHAADDGAHDRLVLGEDAFQTGPGFFAAGLVAADHRFAQRVLDTLQEHLDGVADLDGGLAVFVDAEFLDRDAALGLQTHVDDREVLFDRRDAALHHRAFGEVLAAHALVEKGREVVARGVHAHVVSHLGLQVSVGAGPRARMRGTGDALMFRIGAPAAVRGLARLDLPLRIAPTGLAPPRRYGGPHRRRLL